MPCVVHHSLDSGLNENCNSTVAAVLLVLYKHNVCTNYTVTNKQHNSCLLSLKAAQGHVTATTSLRATSKLAFPQGRNLELMNSSRPKALLTSLYLYIQC